MKILTVDGNAQKLNRSRKAVRNMVMRKQIPFRKIAGRICFFEEEIDQWLEQAPGLTLEEYTTERRGQK